ncbi:MAG: Sua5/YciO/YrdC/YwlC family protein [Gammaproteobacteria bacterium]|nr:Sua5/YciO/YrdC/YwlC family protein [Gammaproteobacteria bacterium]
MSGHLAQAAHVIQKGGVVAYATEYCFGLGCDPMNRAAVLRLLRIKRRPVQKGLILIAASLDQLAPYVDDIPPPVAATWPGPHTWLLTPRDGVPGWITGGHPRIAVRVTAHAQAAALCHAAGIAIVSTSANRSGGEPTRRFRDTVRRFKGEVDYILPGRVGDAPAPTPIRDAITGKLIRPG